MKYTIDSQRHRCDLSARDTNHFKDKQSISTGSSFATVNGRTLPEHEQLAVACLVSRKKKAKNAGGLGLLIDDLYFRLQWIATACKHVRAIHPLVSDNKSPCRLTIGCGTPGRIESFNRRDMRH